MKTRFFYAILLLGLIVLYQYNYEYTLFVLINVMIVLLIPLFIINFITSRFIKINLNFKTKVITKGANALLNISINNESFLPINRAIFYIELQNAFMNTAQLQRIIVPIKADNVTNLQIMIKSEHCGYVRASIKKIVFYDMFGLTSVSKRKNPYDILSVISQITNIKQNIFLPANTTCDSDEFSQNKSGDDRSQVFDYHEYANGDHVKNINWKLSSRMDKLMVKEFSLPLKSSALILFELSSCFKKTKKHFLPDLGVADALFEVLVSLSNKLNQSNFSHTIQWFDKQQGDTLSLKLGINNIYEQDLYMVLREIYRAKFYDDDLLLQEVAKTHEQEYSRIFYITAFLNANMIKILSDINSKKLLTVVFLSPEKISEELNLLLKSELIDLIEININQTSLEIQENFN